MAGPQEFDNIRARRTVRWPNVRRAGAAVPLCTGKRTAWRRGGSSATGTICMTSWRRCSTAPPSPAAASGRVFHRWQETDLGRPGRPVAAQLTPASSSGTLCYNHLAWRLGVAFLTRSSDMDMSASPTTAHRPLWACGRRRRLAFPFETRIDGSAASTASTGRNGDFILPAAIERHPSFLMDGGYCAGQGAFLECHPSREKAGSVS